MFLFFKFIWDFLRYIFQNLNLLLISWFWLKGKSYKSLILCLQNLIYFNFELLVGGGEGGCRLEATALGMPVNTVIIAVFTRACKIEALSNITGSRTIMKITGEWRVQWVVCNSKKWWGFGAGNCALRTSVSWWRLKQQQKLPPSVQI
jgi:hypothetical protein